MTPARFRISCAKSLPSTRQSLSRSTRCCRTKNLKTNFWRRPTRSGICIECWVSRRVTSKMNGTNKSSTTTTSISSSWAISFPSTTSKRRPATRSSWAMPIWISPSDSSKNGKSYKSHKLIRQKKKSTGKHPRIAKFDTLSTTSSSTSWWSNQTWRLRMAATLSSAACSVLSTHTFRQGTRRPS